MRIAIEALGIDKSGGGRSATLNLLEALFAIDKENCYFVFLNRRESRLEVPGANVNQIVVNVKNRFLARIWAQLALPTVLRQIEVDLTHFMKDVGIFLTPGKMVITVHDLATFIYPAFYPRMDVIYWRLIEPLTLERADHIIAVSHNTAHDLERLYGLSKKRISVIYNSCSSSFRPADKAAVARVRQVYGLPPRTIIHVGSISSKKNLTTLVKAFHLLKRHFGFDGKLVLVGRPYRKGEDEGLHRQIVTLGLEKEAIFTGPVPDADLPPLYSSATLAAFPSLYEGFGIALVEAMACGVPVVASNAGAVTEVTDDAALIVNDPLSEEEWAMAINNVIEDGAMRREMIARGRERARCFSGMKAARRTLQVYEAVTSSGR